MNLNERHKGVVLIGQPGIGKSIFLYYILVGRVLGSQVTIFEDRPDKKYIFGESFEAVTQLNPQDYPKAWALSDSNTNLVHPSASFTSASSKFFTLQATSPQPERWYRWMKYRSTVLVAMDLWSWDEIYIGATKFESQKINIEVLKHVFINYSRSARDCYELADDFETIDQLKSSRGVQCLEHSIKKFIRNSPDTDILQGITSGVCTPT